MEERDGRAGGFRKETVDRLLRLHFRDGRTRVNGDALLLTAEMLKVFVRAAARAARQAQAEDLEKVDIEHVEKVLPQLVQPGMELLILKMTKQKELLIWTNI
ncbi:centromere protein X isoform X2 [Apteryx rowi]|uniref:centromere protein X isoform X2 n=1 Tax=Apteryx rowi TaxID=308060 RepID=UPI000E1D1C7A|nr:centromere protein X isoform X2 [Apteryx rowi]